MFEGKLWVRKPARSQGANEKQQWARDSARCQGGSQNEPDTLSASNESGKPTRSQGAGKERGNNEPRNQQSAREAAMSQRASNEPGTL